MKHTGLVLLSVLLIAALGNAWTRSGSALCGSLSRAKRKPVRRRRQTVPELPELKQLDESFKPKSLGKDADCIAGARAMAAIEESHC
jgi:hypothetical protein